jgi:hypothetical protein
MPAGMWGRARPPATSFHRFQRAPGLRLGILGEPVRRQKRDLLHQSLLDVKLRLLTIRIFRQLLALGPILMSA